MTKSDGWKYVHIIEFHKVWRCKDDVLVAKLAALHAAQPGAGLLATLEIEGMAARQLTLAQLAELKDRAMKERKSRILAAALQLSA